MVIGLLRPALGGCAVAALLASAATTGAAGPPTAAARVSARPPAVPAVEVASPAVASAVAGRRDLFWTANGELRQRYIVSGGGWHRAVDLGGSLTSQPAVVSWGPGRFDVFARGGDARLRWRTWRSGHGWSTWRSLGGSLSSAPAATSWERGRLDVFVRGPHRALYQRTYTSGQWSAWRSRGGTLTSSPAATSWRRGRIDVVARGTQRRLVHRSYAAGRGWSGWTNLGGRLSAQPAIAAPAAGRLDVVVRGVGRRLNLRRFEVGSGWSHRRLGDATYTSGPGATAIGNRIVVVARRANGFVYQAARATPTSGWSRWRVVDPYRPFRKLGTWVDIFDYSSLAPSTATARMAARGVRTLFLSTARFDSSATFFDEAEMGRWLDAAHAAGLEVVGWYVPAYGDMQRDVRRTVAIARYVSPGRQRFDAVGVDIERFGDSGEVGHATFNARVVPHLRKVRARTSAVIGAIVPSPYVTKRGNRWEGFPWTGIGRNSEVVVPMALWSKRANSDGSPFTPAQVHDWVVHQIDRAQALTRRRVHIEGGVDDPGAENTPVTAARVQAFVDAVADAGAIGGSHYDYATTDRTLWPILAGING